MTGLPVLWSERGPWNRDQSKLLYTSDFMASILNSPSGRAGSDERFLFTGRADCLYRCIPAARQADRGSGFEARSHNISHGGSRPSGPCIRSGRMVGTHKAGEACGIRGHSLNFCVEGSPSNAIVRLCSERLGYTTTRVIFDAVPCRPTIGEKRDSDRAEPSDDDVELFVELTAAISSLSVSPALDGGRGCLAMPGPLLAESVSATNRGPGAGY